MSNNTNSELPLTDEEVKIIVHLREHTELAEELGEIVASDSNSGHISPVIFTPQSSPVSVNELIQGNAGADQYDTTTTGKYQDLKTQSEIADTNWSQGLVS